ncbi:MAG: hypothetical protein ACRYFX_16650 [Janthinobacterium lividum]
MSAILKEKMTILTNLLERRFLTTQVAENALGFTYLSGPIAFDCKIEVDLNSKSLYLTATLGLPFAEENQLTALEWCNCMNEKLYTGHFAVNPDTGHLKWLSGLYFWKQDLTERIMRTLIESSILTIDHYLASLLYVFNGNAEGEDFQPALALLGKDLGIGVSKSCHYTVEKHPSIERP